MRLLSKTCFAIIMCSIAWSSKAGAQCPDRPASGTIVNDPYSVSSQSGTVSATLTMAQSVDSGGYTHYCYKYTAGSQVVEAPTLRMNPGDTLNLTINNQIQDEGASKMKMDMTLAGTPVCGDGGEATVSSTNVHFHGLNVPPKCHQDDVVNTIIQPTSTFNYSLQIPTTEPPGLYWYHPHVHGFTEFQVNGGAAGAMVVEGMEKYRPEVAGLPEHIFVVRQQFLVPWVPGPYQITVNYETAPFLGFLPFVNMKPGEKQFWRIANATLQDFLELQVIVNGKPEQVQMIALDGYPLAATRNATTISIPPAGRAEFIVTAPPSGGTGSLITNLHSTGPTGNTDQGQTLFNIIPTNTATAAHVMPTSSVPGNRNDIKYANLGEQLPTTQRKIYFSEEFGGTNGPIQFYVTVEGQKQKVFDMNEAPAITTKVGAVEDWTIENRALETHAFHIHQIHFQVLEVDGKPALHHDMLDTLEIPFWDGKGPYHTAKVRMDFRDPSTAGTSVFHCHILLHEDLGMMHKLLVQP